MFPHAFLYLLIEYLNVNLFIQVFSLASDIFTTPDFFYKNNHWPGISYSQVNLVSFLMRLLYLQSAYAYTMYYLAIWCVVKIPTQFFL